MQGRHTQAGDVQDAAMLRQPSRESRIFLYTGLPHIRASVSSRPQRAAALRSRANLSFSPPRLLRKEEHGRKLFVPAATQTMEEKNRRQLWTHPVNNKRV